MSDFEVVEDALRKLPSPRALSPETKALLEGKTLFIPLNGRTAFALGNTFNGAARRYGYRFHRRSYIKDGVPGIVAWMEKAP